MTELITRILNFFGQFKLLLMILPWERAVRVRLGSRVRVWDPGWHIRLPFIDEVFLFNTRLRVADTGAQTLTTLDGHTLTVQIVVGFRIDDPLAAMLKMHNPEGTLAALVGSALAGIVSTSARADLSVTVIETRALAGVADSPYAIDFVKVRTFACVRTYRLLNDPGWASSVTIEERKL